LSSIHQKGYVRRSAIMSVIVKNVKKVHKLKNGHRIQQHLPCETDSFGLHITKLQKLKSGTKIQQNWHCETGIFGNC
jgi:hypothetical protein